VEQVALTIPLVHKPNLCADAITPMDESDATCAWTGSLFMVGGLGVVVWSMSFQFLRQLVLSTILTLSKHSFESSGYISTSFGRILLVLCSYSSQQQRV
jgi:hypothetical protein